MTSADSRDGTEEWFEVKRERSQHVLRSDIPVGGSPAGAGESPALPRNAVAITPSSGKAATQIFP